MEYNWDGEDSLTQSSTEPYVKIEYDPDAVDPLALPPDIKSEYDPDAVNPLASSPGGQDDKLCLKESDGGKSQDSGHASNNQDKKKPHIKKPHIKKPHIKKPRIKKPMNAFMLYMKETRANVVAELSLKESAAINQIMGKRWNALGREKQAKYYEWARRERHLHKHLYPDWTEVKANRGKKRIRKQDGDNSMKKCRAMYGLSQQNQWCKPCRVKKKCIRLMECGDGEGDRGTQSDGDNQGSCDSVCDALTPSDDGVESFNQSLSSPGCNLSFIASTAKYSSSSVVNLTEF